MVNPIKTAATSYPVTDWLRMRWSPRSFSAQEITEHDLLTILEAGTWAFNGGNLQPWFFLYGYKGTEGFKKILSCLNPGNQSWAQNAAVLIVTLAKRERDPGKPNLWSKHDVGAASMGMILQAITMNIYGHPMSGYDPNKIISTLGENGEYQVLNGRFGPYFTFDGNNFKIPAKTDPTTLTADLCRTLVEQQGTTRPKKKYAKKKK